MNILIVSLAFAPFAGVGAARMTSLADYLTSKEHKINVLAYDSSVFGNNAVQRAVPSGLNIKYIKRFANKNENENSITSALLEIIRNTEIEFIIYSVGPYDVMPVIPEVYKKSHIPYILDYRDVWLFEVPTKNIKRIFFDILHLNLEWKIMKNANSVVFVSEGCKQKIAKRYGLQEEKCKIIYNGYENVYFGKTKNINNQTLFSIGVLGKFGYYDKKFAKICLDACSDLLEKNTEIQIKHIGKNDIEDLFGLYPFYKSIGEKTYDEAMGELSNTNACLIVYKHKVGLGTKVFDYISLNKPIIYLGKKNTELETFVKSFENGFVCNKKDELVVVLKKCIAKNINTLTEKGTEFYSRNTQNKKYEKLLMDLSKA